MDIARRARSRTWKATVRGSMRERAMGHCVESVPRLVPLWVWDLWVVVVYVFI